MDTAQLESLPPGTVVEYRWRAVDEWQKGTIKRFWTANRDNTRWVTLQTGSGGSTALKILKHEFRLPGAATGVGDAARKAIAELEQRLRDTAAALEKANEELKRQREERDAECAEHIRVLNENKKLQSQLADARYEAQWRQSSREAPLVVTRYDIHYPDYQARWMNPGGATITITARRQGTDFSFTLLYDKFLEGVFKDIGQGHWRDKYNALVVKLKEMTVALVDAETPK